MSTPWTVQCDRVLSHRPSLSIELDPCAPLGRAVTLTFVASADSCDLHASEKLCEVGHTIFSWVLANRIDGVSFLHSFHHVWTFVSLEAMLPSLQQHGKGELIRCHQAASLQFFFQQSVSESLAIFGRTEGRLVPSLKKRREKKSKWLFRSPFYEMPIQ